MVSTFQLRLGLMFAPFRRVCRMGFAVSTFRLRLGLILGYPVSNTAPHRSSMHDS
jgi:hypothetical protein